LAEVFRVQVGELYKERRPRAEAIDADGRFAALWKDADPSAGSTPAVRILL
jgi:hypothetical protein